MSTAISLTISDELKATLDDLAQQAQIDMSGIFRRAVGLYIASQQAKAEGCGMGLFDVRTKEVVTEFVGL